MRGLRILISCLANHSRPVDHLIQFRHVNLDSADPPNFEDVSLSRQLNAVACFPSGSHPYDDSNTANDLRRRITPVKSRNAPEAGIFGRERTMFFKIRIRGLAR